MLSLDEKLYRTYCNSMKPYLLWVFNLVYHIIAVKLCIRNIGPIFEQHRSFTIELERMMAVFRGNHLTGGGSDLFKTVKSLETGDTYTNP
jgi:hypothetical protein